MGMCHLVLANAVRDAEELQSKFDDRFIRLHAFDTVVLLPQHWQFACTLGAMSLLVNRPLETNFNRYP